MNVTMKTQLILSNQKEDVTMNATKVLELCLVVPIFTLLVVLPAAIKATRNILVESWNILMED